DDDAFKDIEHVEASLPDPEIVSLEEENDVYQEEEESSSSFPIFDESDNSISLLDNSLPEFETFSDQTEETRSGSTTTHDSLPEYDSFCFEIEPDQERLIRVVKNDISDDLSNDLLLEEDDPSFLRPPLEPPDVEFFFDLKPDVIAEEISNELNEDNCFDLGGEIDISTNDEDDDCYPFMFVIRIFLPYLIYPEDLPLND
nr:hypothetical protein [Tanacetum cinerariifolium]